MLTTMYGHSCDLDIARIPVDPERVVAVAMARDREVGYEDIRRRRVNGGGGEGADAVDPHLMALGASNGNAGGVGLRQIMEPIVAWPEDDGLPTGRLVERDVKLCIGTDLDDGSGAGPDNEEAADRDRQCDDAQVTSRQTARANGPSRGPTTS